MATKEEGASEAQSQQHCVGGNGEKQGCRLLQFAALKQSVVKAKTLLTVDWNDVVKLQRTHYSTVQFFDEAGKRERITFD